MPNLYRNVAIVECADRETTDELLDGGLERFVVERYSETVVQVDHQRIDEVLKVLRRHSQTPRITRE